MSHYLVSNKKWALDEIIWLNLSPKVKLLIPQCGVQEIIFQQCYRKHNYYIFAEGSSLVSFMRIMRTGHVIQKSLFLLKIFITIETVLDNLTS